jgi:hypothetical protein
MSEVAEQTTVEPTVETAVETQAQPSLISQGDAGNAADTDWMKGIDQEYMGSQTVSTAKTANDLAKQVYNLEKVMGKPKIELPQEGWTDAQYNDFYNKTGRPESAEGYSLDGLPEQFTFTDEDKSSLLTSLHEQGLNNKQANAVMKSIADREVGLSESVDAKFNETHETAVNQLKENWGDQFENKLKLASATLSNVTDPDSAEQLKEMAGNNPAFIKMLADLGDKMLAEDSAFQGSMSSNAFTSPVAAQGEITQLKGDPLFLQQLQNNMDPGHKTALARWTNLHAQAFPE